MKTKIKKEKPISYKAAIAKIKKLEEDIATGYKQSANSVARLEETYERKINTLATVLGYDEDNRGMRSMSISTGMKDPYSYVLSRLREVRGEDQGQAFHAMREELVFLRSLVASRFEVDRKNPLLPKKCTGIDNCDFCKGIDC